MTHLFRATAGQAGQVSMAEGRPAPLGARFDGEGVNFALFSENAERVELCLFSEDGRTELQRIALPERTGPVWHGYAPGLRPGALYGFRVHGPFEPRRGHRFNPNKLLLDPYARAFSGRLVQNDAVLGYDPQSHERDLSFSTLDSAPFVPRCVVTDPHRDWNGDRPPRRPWTETVIYEAHAKGLTRLFPDIDPDLRGTYQALAAEPVLDHLLSLGITAVELLPVHAFVDEGFLLDQGLRNYWGYNSIGFFALEPRYAGPSGAEGFRRMVERFHSAGIEVLLDVVYNHTAEGNELGPTLSFRGIDNAAYYSLLAGQPRHYVNDTGCGNTLNVKHPFVMRMILDSLRYWVEEMHIDGFRFDLATSLGREEHGFSQTAGFFDALRQDPVLAQVKLIAEPWDVGPGGYQLGGFPPEFAEWNDRFRDAARRFWRRDGHSAQELAGCLLGSAANFDRGGRHPWASVNMIAAHDGFTLADVTSYDHKHNEANSEANHDGHHANFSDNCGTEGPTGDPEIRARRAQRRRNLLATLFLSQGTPMLLAGDEIGNSQSGNNNAYCQDNEISWVGWPDADQELLDFVRRLSAFRRAHPVLRQCRFLHGQKRTSDGQPDVEWMQFDGAPLNWRDPTLDRFCLLLRGSAEAPCYCATDDRMLIAINGSADVAELALPDAAAGGTWLRGLDTAAPRADTVPAGATERIQPHSVVAFHAAESGPAG